MPNLHYYLVTCAKQAFFAISEDACIKVYLSQNSELQPTYK